MNLKKYIILIILPLLLTGCKINYNLDISKKGFKESFNIISNIDNKLEKYEIPAFIGTIDYEDIDINFLERYDEVEYYNNKVTEKNDQQIINYNYVFDDKNIQKSNAINLAFEKASITRYDHDENGKKDYMIISTSGKSNIFEKFNDIEEITINITCHYEIISSNADEINKNVYTWHLDKNNIKAINMVYNPDKFIDYRTIWEKIIDGDYFNIFTVTLFIVGIGLIIYILLKKKSNNIDKI